MEIGRIIFHSTHIYLNFISMCNAGGTREGERDADDNETFARVVIVVGRATGRWRDERQLNYLFVRTFFSNYILFALIAIIHYNFHHFFFLFVGCGVLFIIVFLELSRTDGETKRRNEKNVIKIQHTGPSHCNSYFMMSGTKSRIGTSSFILG